MPEIKFDPKYLLIGVVVILLVVGLIKVIPALKSYGSASLPKLYAGPSGPDGAVQPEAAEEPAPEPAEGPASGPAEGSPSGAAEESQAPAVGRPDVPYPEAPDIQAAGSLVGTVIQPEEASAE